MQNFSKVKEKEKFKTANETPDTQTLNENQPKLNDPKKVPSDNDSEHMEKLKSLITQVNPLADSKKANDKPM